MNRRFILVLLLLLCAPAITRGQQSIFVPNCSGNATADTAALNSLISVIGTTVPGTIQIPSKRDVTKLCKFNTITLNSNITLDVTHASFQVVTGQTVTIQGPIVGKPKKTFYNALSGQGTVSLAGNIGLTEIYTEWWGAKADAASGAVGTDSTAAFNAAMVQTGRVVKLVKGGYRVTANLDIPLCAAIVGSGKEDTIIYASSAVKRVLQVISTWRLEDFQIDGTATTDAIGLLPGPDAIGWVGQIRRVRVKNFGGTAAQGVRFGFALKSEIAGLTVEQSSTDQVVQHFSYNITAITNANPAVITTSVAHSFVTGESWTLSGAAGSLGSTLNGNTYVVTVLSPTTFSIPVNTSALSAYGGSGASAFQASSTTVTWRNSQWTTSTLGPGALFADGQSLTLDGCVAESNTQEGWTFLNTNLPLFVAIVGSSWLESNYEGATANSQLRAMAGSEQLHLFINGLHIQGNAHTALFDGGTLSVDIREWDYPNRVATVVSQTDAFGTMKLPDYVDQNSFSDLTSGRYMEVHYRGGIIFPGTQVVSSSTGALDDYKQGIAFTPTIILGSGSVTYTTQTGAYQKAGRWVTVEGTVTVATATSPSGTVQIGGLPFASSAGEKGVATISGAGLKGLITGITLANPCVITVVAHGLASGQIVRVAGAASTLGTAINGTRQVTVLTADTFSIPVDTTGLSSYGGGASISTYLGLIGELDAGAQTIRVYAKAPDDGSNNPGIYIQAGAKIKFNLKYEAAQ